MSDPKLSDEAGRLLALHRYCALDSVHEPNFDTITGIVKDLLGVPVCAVSLIDAEEQRFKAIQGADVQRTPRAGAFCDYTIRSREGFVVPDARQDPRFADSPLVTDGLKVRAYAGTPLTTPDGYNVGALCAIDQERRDFSPGDIALLGQFAKIVVEQMELRTLAHRDPLTGVLTRRAFLDAASAALHQLGPQGGGAVLGVVDIDHFRRINDSSGRGDLALKALARTAQAQLGPSDLFGRLGGEEFGILLASADVEGALREANALREAVAGLRLEGLPPFAVSIGLAPLHGAADLEAALAGAEGALSLAKRQGRNRCVVAGEATNSQAA